MRVLLSGGGTAGHINPAIAIAKYIKQKEPESEFLFIGTEHGLEKTLVPREGFEIKFVEVMGLVRKITPKNLKVLKCFVSSRIEAGKIVEEFKPDIVIGTGGYACTPAVYAAQKRGIPSVIHEQNVVPGLAIKMLAKRADVTAISFADTESHVEANATALTGNPLRPSLFEKVDVEAVRESLGFLDEPLVLLFGGSLGAERMNDALIDMIAEGFGGFNLIAATGEKHYEAVCARLKERDVDLEETKNLSLVPYIYNMDKVLGAADLVVSRAGAITVSELCALGKPSVLIPSPYVAHNHQEMNARYLEKNGAASVLLEKDLSGAALRGAIENALSDAEKLDEMASSAAKIGITDACEKIYLIAKKLIDKRKM
ncbi:MAG: undecaprenyldiphospho-muramoylpentapeptide beta-N-acetylglucosaminyltransferase [Clostridia bacterium]|nr:undecaprenyldiphospho-muramoylpentapeptide beta-N-acetylglucosaminyltransferase [Clostridia bacterium]